MPERVAWACVPPLIGGVGRIVWRLETDFGDGFPDPPFVVASNHHSFLDAFLIAAAFRRKIRFLALKDLFGNYRWVDFALNSFDVIPLRRGTVPLGPVRTALDYLSAGGVVGLFPEGTRHREFDPNRARPGAAWLATRTDLPLVPVAVAGTERVLGPDNRLHYGQIRVTVGPVLRRSGLERADIDDLTARWAEWVAVTLRGS